MPSVLFEGVLLLNVLVVDVLVELDEVPLLDVVVVAETALMDC